MKKVLYTLLACITLPIALHPAQGKPAQQRVAQHLVMFPGLAALIMAIPVPANSSLGSSDKPSVYGTPMDEFTERGLRTAQYYGDLNKTPGKLDKAKPGA